MSVFPPFPPPPDLRRRPVRLKECGLCHRLFDKVSVLRTNDHVIPDGWFNDVKPKNLPTWPVCFDCQQDLSPREDRLRNIFAAANSHFPEDLQSVYGRTARATRRPVAVGRKMVKHSLGFELPASIAIPNQLDMHMVFMKIAKGLHWYREGKLPTDHRFEVRLPNAEDFGKWSNLFKDHYQVQRLGPEIGWMSVHDPAEPDWNVWLFIIFEAVPVMVFNGEAVNFPLPDPAGVVLREDAPYITPGLISL